jgi:hypothetical protein
MMEWMSRILVGETAGADLVLAPKLGKCSHFTFAVQVPTTNPTQHDPHEPDDPFRTITYDHLDISGHDGMDEQDIVWRNGWC